MKLSLQEPDSHNRNGQGLLCLEDDIPLVPDGYPFAEPNRRILLVDSFLEHGTICLVFLQIVPVLYPGVGYE